MKLERLYLIYTLIISFLFLGFVHGQNENDQEEEVKTESNRIAVVVNKWLEPEIEANLKIYLNDLRNERYEPILKIWDLENEPSPVALRGWLKGEYKDRESGSLQGAVLIGDLPIPYMKAHAVLQEMEDEKYIQISDSYIAEMYYMELISEKWSIPNDKENWFYPSPKIWISHITTSTLTELFQNSESDLVNAYLEKNHAYRTGKVVFSKLALMYSLPKILKNDTSFDEWAFNEIFLILSERYNFLEKRPAFIDSFFEPLENESYEIFYWGRHGLKTSIDLGSQRLKSTLLSVIPVYISTAFVFPSSCWIGHYIEPGYFGGAYTFNKHFFVLGMPTATLPTYGDPEVDIINEFIAGKNLGTAFKEAIKLSDLSLEFRPYRDFRYAESRITSRKSRYLIGDGTLKLQPNEFVADENNSPQKYLEKHYPYSIDQKSLQENIRDYSGIRYLEKFAERGADLGLVMLDAVQEDNKEAVEQLLKMDVRLDARNKYGYTAFELAMIHNRSEIMKLILEKDNSIIDVPNQNGNTPLMYAATREKKSMVELLLKYKPNIEARDKYGYTTLQKVVFEPETHERIEIIKLLIDAGAKVEARNHLGQTAWDIAKEKGYSAETLELLKVPEKKEL